MATIGLRVNQGPTLNLSGIFKNAMADPELAIKGALARSQIWGQEHQNQLYDQSAEEKRQLAVKAAQEAADLRTLAEKRAAAVAGTEQGLVGAISLPPNQPVPVELSRIAGPVNGVPVSAPPAIVDQNYYDSQVAGAKAQAGLMPYIAKDATDFATAYNKDRGGNVIAAGLTPGGPAAVTPDQYRLASELYTGSAPTTSTMVTSGDTAPAVNAVREAAGKLPYNIAQDRAQAEAKAQADAAANPLGTSGVGPAAVHLAALKAKAPGSLTPEEQQLIPLLQGIVDKETAVTPGKDAPIFVPDGKGGFKQTAGPVADPNAPVDPFSSNSVSADSKNIIARTALKMMRGQPLTDADSVAYRTAYESEHPDHPIVVKDTNGIPSTIDPVPPPPDIPTPAEVDAAVAAGPVPSAGGAAAMIPPEVARLGASPAGAAVKPAFLGRTALPSVGATKIAGLDAAPPPTEFQQKNRQFASPLLNATIELDKITADQLPGRAAAAAISSTGGSSGGPSSFLGDYGDLVLRDTFLGGPDTSERLYERSLNAYIGPELYALSGMAIKPEEFARQMSANAPKYGDGPETLARKTVDRHNFLKAVIDGGYATDPKELAQQYALAKQGGLDLTSFVLYDGNKTSLMPPTTAAQIAAVTAGLKGAPVLDTATPATTAAPAALTPASAAPATLSTMTAAPPVAPAAGAKLPQPAAPQGFTAERFSRLWNAMTVEQQQTYLNNLKHQGQ